MSDCPTYRQHVCHPEPAQRGEGPRKQILGSLVRSLFVLRRIGMASIAAAAICLTTSQSTWAIGGVDQPPAPSAPRRVKFAPPKEARLQNGLRVAMQQPGAIVRYAASRVVFGTGPYGHAIPGTLETLQAIKRDDIVQFYRKFYAPRNAAFILAGAVTLAEGEAFAEKFFGDWK